MPPITVNWSDLEIAFERNDFGNFVEYNCLALDVLQEVIYPLRRQQREFLFRFWPCQHIADFGRYVAAGAEDALEISGAETTEAILTSAPELKEDTASIGSGDDETMGRL